MSSSDQREMVFCHRCQRQWFRDEHGSMACPHCASEFVEVVSFPEVGWESRNPGGSLDMDYTTPDNLQLGRASLTRSLQIEANNDPHEFLHSRDDDDDDDDDDNIRDGHNHWTPVGGGSLPGNLGTYGHPGFPFSSFPQQPANRAGPDFRYTEHRTPGGGMVFTSFSYRTNNPGAGPPDSQAQIMNSFGGLMQGLLGNLQTSRGIGGNSPHGSPLGSPPLESPFGAPPGFPPPLRPRDPNSPQQPQQPVDQIPNIMSQFFPPQAGHRVVPVPLGPHGGMQGGMHDGMPPSPLMSMMRMILSGHPMLNGGGHGDAAYSQEDFDRIMSQLLEQAQQGGGVPPAPQQEISRLPKTTITQDWLDAQEHKECTICLNEAQLEEEINELWCGHWYHPECIRMWLDSHDQCPLCRKPLQQSREEFEARQAKSPRRERRPSRSQSQNYWRGSRGGGGDDGGSGSSGGSSENTGNSLRDRISSIFRTSR